LMNTKSCDFVAVKVGDVNETASPNTMLGAVIRNDKYKKATFKVENWEKNTVKNLEINVEDLSEIEGLQMALNFDSNQLVYVGVANNSEITSESVYYDEKNSILNISYIPMAQNNKYPKIIFQFIPKQYCNTSNLFSLNQKVMHPELYTTNQVYTLQLESKEENTADFSIINVMNSIPNDSWKVNYYSPKEEIFDFQITDEIGRKIYTHQQNALIGSNSIQLNTSKFTNGIYFYTLTNKQKILSGKMIVFK
jgi:hypothetical protein